MKANVMMKTLSLAVLGLAGMGFAGGAMAACATGAAQPAGAWSGTAIFSGGAQAITTPGLKGTECTAAMSFNAGAGGTAASMVRDDTPNNETRYRVRFVTDLNALTGFSGVQGVQIFTANSAAAFPAAGGSIQTVRLGLIPGGATGKQVSIVAACNVPANGYLCTAAAPLAATGENTIELEVVFGGTGTGKVNYWINNGTAGTPTGTLNVDNAGWVGVDQIFMGLSNGTTSFRTTQATRQVKFDEFDSRRQTFIGL